jgi:hypothetical protein
MAEHLDRGREAFARHAWTDACDLLTAADRAQHDLRCRTVRAEGRRDRREPRSWRLLSAAHGAGPMRALFAALHENQEATNRFFSALTGSTSIQAFMRPENIDRITASAQRLHATGS